MAERRGSKGPHLTLVAGGPEPEGPAQAPDLGVAAEPVLMGLILCGEGGQALGVVREVLGWDGRELSLSLQLAPGSAQGGSRVVVRLPVGGARPNPVGRLRTAKP